MSRLFVESRGLQLGQAFSTGRFGFEINTVVWQTTETSNNGIRILWDQEMRRRQEENRHCPSHYFPPISRTLDSSARSPAEESNS